MASLTLRRFPSFCPLVAILFVALLREVHGISCVQCEADSIPGAPDPPCIANPPPPQPCNGSMTVCMTVRTYIPAEEDTRQLVSVVRTCAPSDMGWDCKKGRTSRGHVPEVCHDTCYWDGCNHAHALTPTMLLPLLSTLVWLGFHL
ncbi:uncharacterized protein LOC134773886 [Penaeus indicus]|uniref:uncharacterized protein LOC134773886 n=1 Tax=Penaeus indicus TaxID=29960 RepID=UPI00300CAB94